MTISDDAFALFDSRICELGALILALIVVTYKTQSSNVNYLHILYF